MTKKIKTKIVPSPKLARILPELKRLRYRMGPWTLNKEIVLQQIATCIVGGINDKPNIVEVLEYNYVETRHSVPLLDQHQGDDASVHRWRLDENGTYHLHDQAIVEATQRAIDKAWNA